MHLEPERGYTKYLANRKELSVASLERRKLGTDPWPDKGTIQFINLKCKYRPNLQLILKGVDVTFEGGKKIGIVGRTGSGKSTIMLCLLRIL